MNTTINHPIDREDGMAWLDGELSGARALEISLHVDGCTECQALAGELRALSSRLAEWEVEQSPQRVSAAVAGAPSADRAAAVAAPRVTPMWRRAHVWGLAAAVVVVLLVVPGVWMATSPPEPERRTMTISMANRAAEPAPQGLAPSAVQTGPMIVRTASLTLTTDAFDRARADIERVATEHGGEIAALDVSGAPPQPRSLRATLRIPAARLDAALAALRQTGRVEQETLGSDDVTDRYRDLTVRIANSRREEERLVELLAMRTGTLADVLAVEQALGRVRGEIERMESEERATKGRVDLAAITLQLSENYRAEASLGSIAIGTQFRNAFLDGSRAALDGLTSVALAIVRLAPTLLVWTIILAWPARALWRARWR
jgi:hypothetical protein